MCTVSCETPAWSPGFSSREEIWVPPESPHRGSLFVARTLKAIDYQGVGPKDDEMQEKPRRRLPAEQLKVS